MRDKIRLVALGGLDSHGQNLYCVEINDDIFVVSAGLGYPDKSAPGIDYVIPDISYLKENKDRVKAYIISHAHDDTLFGLPFIYNDVPAPIYMTNFTKEIFDAFVKSLGYKDPKFDIHIVNPNDDLTISGVKFKLFSIIHSTPFTFGISIGTSEGNIVFMGDYIVEYNIFDAFSNNFRKIISFSEGKEKVFALLINSTNAGSKGYTSPHHKCAPIIWKALNDCDGRLYLALYNSNFYNVVEAFLTLQQSGRYVCFYDEETREIYDMLVRYNIFKMPESRIITVDDLIRFSDKDVAIIMTGPGELLYRKISLLALKDVKEKRFYIKESDTFAIIAPPAPNFEVLSVGVLDELYRTDCKVVFTNRKELKKMHPCEDDIKLLTSTLCPKYYIPIKGQYKDMMANASIAAAMNIGLNHQSIFLVDNGYAIDFENGELKNISSIEKDNIRVGSILVDGTGIGDVANDIIQERNQLAQDGVVVMSCLVSREQKAIVGGPDIQMRGYLYLKESEQILKKIQTMFIDIVTDHLNKGVPFDEELCIKEIKDTCSKYTKRATLRTPIIEPQILILD